MSTDCIWNIVYYLLLHTEITSSYYTAIYCVENTHCDIHCEEDVSGRRLLQDVSGDITNGKQDVDTNGCAGVGIHCPTNDICRIYCTYSCKNITVYAQSSTALYISQCGNAAMPRTGCDNMNIYCPKHATGTNHTCVIGDSTSQSISGLKIYTQQSFHDVDITTISLEGTSNTIYCGQSMTDYSCNIDGTLPTNSYCTDTTSVCQDYQITSNKSMETAKNNTVKTIIIVLVIGAVLLVVIGCLYSVFDYHTQKTKTQKEESKYKKRTMTKLTHTIPDSEDVVQEQIMIPAHRGNPRGVQVMDDAEQVQSGTLVMQKGIAAVLKDKGLKEPKMTETEDMTSLINAHKVTATYELSQTQTITGYGSRRNTLNEDTEDNARNHRIENRKTTDLAVEEQPDSYATATEYFSPRPEELLREDDEDHY